MIYLIITLISILICTKILKVIKRNRLSQIDIFYGKPRHPKWPAVRLEHLNKHRACEVCDTTENCQVHHIKPFHIFPELELISSNLITLCEKHHFEWGHLGNWRNWNPYIWHDIRKYKKGVD